MSSLKELLLRKKKRFLQAKQAVALWLALDDDDDVKKDRKKRSYVRPLNWSRNQHGEFHLLVQDMYRRLNGEGDPQSFFEYFRMSREDYDSLLRKVEKKLTRARTHKFPVGASERLAVTLRILSTGDSVKTVAFSYRLGKATVNRIVRETSAAIYESLKGDYLKDPSQYPEIWEKNAEDFQTYWNYPNCIGAIDGKHVMVQAPRNEGSQYYNYKGQHSVVLMAVANARYQFTAINVGGYGSRGDGGTFAAWALSKKLVNGTLNIPEPKEIVPGGEKMPHVFVADEAFPLTCNIMIPYAGSCLDKEKRIANYRLSRARRIVENAFGILAARWQIFKRAIYYQPIMVDNIVKACVVLHNFLCTSREHTYKPATFIDRELEDGQIVNGEWRNEASVAEMLTPLPRSSLPRQVPNKEAKRLRDAFKTYFNSNVGKVSWQDKAAFV